MRDLMMLGAMCLLLPLALRSAYSAYLLWGWGGLIAINTFMFGFMQGVPYVQIFAILALALFLVKKDPFREKLEFDGTVLLFIVFGLHALLVAALAYSDVPRNWELCFNLLKTLLFCLLMPMLATNRLRIHALLVMLALSAGFHGMLEGLKFIGSGGAHLSQGNAKLGDRNHFAVLVAMVIPILIYLYNYANNRLARLGYLAVITVNFLAVISTQSRAGLVTLAALALWYLMFSRRKLMGAVAIVAVVVGMVAVAPDSWTHRMETMKSVEDDSSFMGRVMAWKRGSAIAVENPIFGGGFHSVQAASLFERFRYRQGILGFVDTGIQAYPAAAHSIYFEILGDMGFLGLFLFIGLIVNAFVNRSAISRLSRFIGPPADWARDLANALAACMLAYVVGGASISAGYFELPYLIIMLMSVVRLQVMRSFRQEKKRQSAAVPIATAARPAIKTV